LIEEPSSFYVQWNASTKLANPLTDPYATLREPALNNLIRAVDAYRAYTPSHSLLIVEAFLLVAARGPISASEIARAIRVPLVVAAQALETLSSGGRAQEPSAPQLVSRVGHPQDARPKLAALSQRGSRVASAMRVALGVKR
jgi:hypothetical protein